jgi:uncharacterized repeat protein (TIGR01451 family)
MSLRLKGLWAALLGLGALGIAGCCPPDRPRATPQPERRANPNCVSVALPTGAESSSVLLIEKCGPSAEVRANVPFEYTITARNLTRNLMLRNVVVQDWLPGPFRMSEGEAPPPNRPATAAPPPAAPDAASALLAPPAAPPPPTAPGASGMTNFDVGDLKPGEAKTIRIRGVATDAGILTNCISAAYVPYACLETRVVAPQLLLRLQGPDGVLICGEAQEVTLKFTARNAGTGVVNNVRITAGLPRELEAVGEVVSNVGNLAAGQARDFDLRVRVRHPGAYVVTGRAVGDQDAAAQATDLRFTAHAANIEIEAVGPATEYIGLPIEYRIRVRNEGDAPDRDVVVESTVPPGTAFVDASAGGAVSGTNVVWRIGNLPAGEAREVFVRYRAEGAERAIRNVITARGACGGSASAAVVTELKGVPAILVEVVDVYDPHRIGETEEYRITVTDQGSAPETNIRIVCEVPEEMTYLRATGPTPPTEENGRVRFAPLPSLGPKQSATWSVFVRCDRPGDVRFAVSVDSDEHGRPVRETEATRIYE